MSCLTRVEMWDGEGIGVGFGRYFRVLRVGKSGI